MLKLMFLKVLLLQFVTMSAMAESVNENHYGNCAVRTHVDDFTDETTFHALFCIGESKRGDSLGDYVFGITCGADAFVALQAGLQFHLEDRIDVRYRWGKNEAQRDVWIWWNGTTALARDSALVDVFLDGMATTERLIYQVGDNSGLMRIGQAERAAVPDLKARCGK